MSTYFRPPTIGGATFFAAPDAESLAAAPFEPREGFAVAVMGADVGGSTDEWSVWFECLGGEPKAGDQVEYPLLSDAGAAVSMDSRGVLSLDYSDVDGYESLTSDQVSGLRSWSEGVRSEPVNKTITIEGVVEPVAPSVTINDYTGTDTTPLLSGTIDNEAASITVSIGGQTYAGVISGTSWTAQVTAALAVNSYTATVTATHDGLTDTDMATVTVQAVAVGPEVAINPYSGYDRTPLLSGTVSDPDADVTLLVNGHSYVATVVGEDWTAQVLNSLPIGPHVVTVTAANDDGETTATETITIELPEPGTTAATYHKVRLSLGLNRFVLSI